MRKWILSFYHSLIVGSIPLALGLVLIPVSHLTQHTSIGICGIACIALGLAQMKDLRKYGDEAPKAHDNATQEKNDGY
ncbi:hypothetical protein J4N45_09915 [Vibrio sp. SCSIO 43140]|uniref:hypothetical protein n=1 Tax=Vibrio sp. SCSIO 43140 TaxID=2819100 RepID=UPI0020750553|nr:hypothetical protein [Vibrio sp. SCSIO 43140]USD58844.1 hypothetical protein J4N45_09915 [Vibrio sp. SCSIO 43140]